MKNKTIIMTIILMMFTIVGAMCASEIYKLNAGDAISVNVAGNDEYKADYLIPPDGNIMILDVGIIDVRGMTILELSEKVTEALKSQLNDPQVIITLKTIRPQPIYISGYVKTSGVLDYKAGWTLSNAITSAGGILDAAAAPNTKVILFRNNVPILETTASDVFSINQEMNPKLLPGDSISVEAPLKLSIYVLGEVTRPGAYQIPVDEANVLQAISMAGGITEKADTSNISLKRLSGETNTLDMTDQITGIDTETDFPLKTGDIVIVSENKNKFAVIGAVKKPGVFLIKNNQQVKLSDALALAEGMRDKKSGTEKIAILRDDQRIIINYRKYLASGDEKYNPDIYPGDVVFMPEFDRFDFDTIIRAAAGIGGLRYLFD